MVNISYVNFACDDPDAMATFWADTLEGERRDLPPSAEIEIVDQVGDRPSLMFREATRGTDEDLPIHLDLGAEDRSEAVERLEELGATVRETKSIEDDGYELTWTAMEDPEGNGFCVSEHE
ncbi:VOC family protein [Natrarchaeobius sp. A-rgal3]|uniref:VOC family protein n=1 Tax=Natrarchaeobius versutus TaxID=1679078 RepID=UPI00350FE5E1